ncbi:hypothetical protein E2C01_046489 [Portunus trituberculatus]|uniref:Uncharacterized protein n=1 Tax=Portunus trituberculatus TaxID=210409 RepID=A0A5B7G4Z1_PORTR|nr:hypothetical protein [Portunus trituberculatus]
MTAMKVIVKKYARALSFFCAWDETQPLNGGSCGAYARQFTSSPSGQSPRLSGQLGVTPDFVGLTTTSGRITSAMS